MAVNQIWWVLQQVTSQAAGHGLPFIQQVVTSCKWLLRICCPWPGTAYHQEPPAPGDHLGWKAVSMKGSGSASGYGGWSAYFAFWCHCSCDQPHILESHLHLVASCSPAAHWQISLRGVSWHNAQQHPPCTSLSSSSVKTVPVMGRHPRRATLSHNFDSSSASEQTV